LNVTVTEFFAYYMHFASWFFTVMRYPDTICFGVLKLWHLTLIACFSGA